MNRAAFLKNAPPSLTQAFSRVGRERMPFRGRFNRSRPESAALGLCLAWILLALLAAPNLLCAAGPGDEVIVVYNSRVPESREVAEYYAARRQVPTNQVFGFSLTTNEDIPRAEFEFDLQHPLARRLQESGLWKISSVAAPTNAPGAPAGTNWGVRETKVRYAVLCYGVPLRIEKDPNLHEPINESTPAVWRADEAAVDSELACLPDLENHPPISGPLKNPLFAATNEPAFSPTNGILMVARLDGPSAAIARGLVDKALEAEQDGLWGRAYFDLRGLTNTTYKQGDDWLGAGAEICRHLGFETVVDNQPAVFPVEFPMSNIAIYCGWLSDNVAGPFTRPEVEFMPGAFAYHLYSFSAQSVRTADRFWVGPLLAKGATITLGNVYEPVLGGTPDIPIFLSRLIYHGFTFGESAYASLGFVSWQTTVVGDPLYRPFGRSPEMLHAQLYLQRSPLVEWSHLRRINMNLANGVALQTAATRLEQIPITKSSPVLLEKLADLYAALGKPTSATETWQKALDFGPSPQQRVRLRLEIARKLEDLGRPQDEYNDLKALVEEIPDYPAKDAIYRRLIALAEDLKHPDDVQGWTLLLNRPKTAPE